MKKLVVVLFCWQLLHAQEYRGALLGRVTDPSGGVIPNAAVSVTNEKTNIRSLTETNAEGNFIFPPLDPGVYTIRAEAPGFKTSVTPGVTIRVGERLNLNLELEVGAVG